MADPPSVPLHTLGPPWTVCVPALRHAQNVNKKPSTPKKIYMG